MNRLRPQPSWMLAATGILLLGGAGWLVRDLATVFFDSHGQSPWLALLQDGQKPSMAPAPGLRSVPAPPAQAPWVSPLQSSCVVHDPIQRSRLQRLLARVRTSATQVRVDPSNYGSRFRRDAFGNPLDPTPRVVVLHETVYGLGSAISTFVTRHVRDDEQVSYHALIGGDGSVVQLVDPNKRAFGAGNSAFNNQWVVTNPQVGGSVNNFALHVSLETPLDGENDKPGHSGYSQAQYDALTAVLADWMMRFQIPAKNITTHRAVDLGGERGDPRSFDWQALQERLQALGMLC